MSHLIALFLLGFKQFFSRRNLIVFLVMLLLLFYGVNKGIYNYKVMVENSKEFQKIEAMMFANVMTYLQYSNVGVRYMYVPSASVIFFTVPPLMSELAAKINSTINLDIYNNCKGSSVFASTNRDFLRFSGLLVLLGTLFVLFTGYESMYNKEYLKFLSSKFSHLKVFIAVIFSRFISIVFSLLVLFGLMLGVVRLRGIVLMPTDVKGLWVYLLSTLLILLIFLVIGGMIGTMRSNTICVSMIMGVWIVSVFIIPGLFDSIIEGKADDIVSSYKSDLNKYKKAADFERISEEKYGKFDQKNIVSEREIIEDLWKNLYPKIAEIEERLKNEISQMIDKYRKLNILFPTSFYNLTALEVSSRGYENYLDFYNYTQDNQKKFSRFWLDRVYYNDPKELVSFIKGEENIFQAKSRIPRNFVPGVVLHLFYAAALLLGSYIRFKKWLYAPIDKRTFNKKDREIRLKREMINVLYSHRHGLRDQLYLSFSRRASKRKLPISSFDMTLEGETISETSLKDGFVYICHPSALPGDIKPVDLISFIARTNGVSAAEKTAITRSLSADFLSSKKFNRLEPHQQAEVLLAVLPYIKSNIYLVDQVGKEMPLLILVKLKDQLTTLVKRGAVVIYLTSDKRVEALPTQPEREVLDLPDWFEAVEAHRFLLDEETGRWRTIVRPEL